MQAKLSHAGSVSYLPKVYALIYFLDLFENLRNIYISQEMRLKYLKCYLI